MCVVLTLGPEPVRPYILLTFLDLVCRRVQRLHTVCNDATDAGRLRNKRITAMRLVQAWVPWRKNEKLF